MILSVDDGCASDVRVAELARKYDIETVFYWPVEWHSLAYDNGYEPLNFFDAFDIAKDFEIGSHTITHRHLTKITHDEAVYEMIVSKALLERMFDKNITKFAPPRGYTNEHITEDTLGTIYKSQRLTKGQGLVHIHPNSGANGNIPWRDYYHKIKDSEENVELWGHSHEWDRFQMWDEIEEFLSEQYRIS